MAKKWTHVELCAKAVTWLKRPLSNKGHACKVALSEVASIGEIPDAIGWRSTGDQMDGSIIIEVKVSRSDFLADKKKPHRNGQTLGLGKWRYFMCPDGLIQPDELPNKWGLVYVTNRGGYRVIRGPMSTTRWQERNELHEQFAHPHDMAREQYILVKMLARVGDAEKLNRMLREESARTQHYAKRAEKAERELRNANTKLFSNSLKEVGGKAAD